MVVAPRIADCNSALNLPLLTFNVGGGCEVVLIVVGIEATDEEGEGLVEDGAAFPPWGGEGTFVGIAA